MKLVAGTSSTWLFILLAVVDTRTASGHRSVRDTAVKTDETIIISEDDPTSNQQLNNVSYCDKVSESLLKNRSMLCVEYKHCQSISLETSEQIRRLTCGLKIDGSIRVCCANSSIEAAHFMSQSESVEPEAQDTRQPELAAADVPPSAKRNEKSLQVYQSETLVITDEQPINKKSDSITSTRSGEPNQEQSATSELNHTKFNSNCGHSVDSENMYETRIIGGQVARRNAWPWFGLVMVRRRASGKMSPECGATLISDKFLLTAAHCVLEQNKRSLRSAQVIVRLGEFDLRKANDGELDFGIARIIPHPNFNQKTFKNDIALIELDRRISSFNESISPACLPHDDLRLANQTPGAVDNQTCWVLGFGQTSYNGRTSDQLKQADLRIVPHAKCKRAFGHLVRLTREYVCAASQTDDDDAAAKSKSNINDSCQGDSGGPLMMKSPAGDSSATRNNRWYIYGIVSFGYRCASSGFPGVYTRVNRYLDWVEAHL